MLTDITRDVIQMLYAECKKRNNEKRLRYVMRYLSSIALGYISPYFYAIMAILVIMFLMNFVQFFYYFKLVSSLPKSLINTDIITQ